MRKRRNNFALYNKFQHNLPGPAELDIVCALEKDYRFLDNKNLMLTKSDLSQIRVVVNEEVDVVDLRYLKKTVDLTVNS